MWGGLQFVQAWLGGQHNGP